MKDNITLSKKALERLHADVFAPKQAELHKLFQRIKEIIDFAKKEQRLPDQTSMRLTPSGKFEYRLAAQYKLLIQEKYKLKPLKRFLLDLIKDEDDELLIYIVEKLII